MYKAEQIKPKRYPQNKPSKSCNYWIIAGGGYVCNFGWLNNVDMWSWDKHVSWFIGIPGAPPELKPLAYPENKPSEDGEYWVHDVNRDIWSQAIWDGDMLSVWGSNVDWFIPVRLDKDDEMETKYCDIRDDDGEMQIVMDWDNKTKEVHLRERDLDKYEAVRIFSAYLDDVGYDVTKREPEIKGCPFCGSPVSFIPSERTSYHQLECMSCEYRSPSASTLPEAIHLHNLIAGKGVGE